MKLYDQNGPSFMKNIKKESLGSTKILYEFFIHSVRATCHVHLIMKLYNFEGGYILDYKTGDPSITNIRSFCLVLVVSERSDPSNQHNELHEIATAN